MRTIKTQDFRENENEDLCRHPRSAPARLCLRIPQTARTHHSDEQPRLLRSPAHTSVTDDTDGEARNQGDQTLDDTVEVYVRHVE